ncbi:MAG: hypothetical protein R2750_04185 [Bacteroidales bacterium]
MELHGLVVLSTSNYRTELAVSINNPSVVYAVMANGSGGLAGVYKSTTSGSSKAHLARSPDRIQYVKLGL